MSEIIQTQDTRRVFVETLNDIAVDRDNIVVIIPDVGFNYLDGAKNFRVVNTGVAEEFAAIFAATLALDGWKPFLYSMINFVLFRPAEMVRNGIVCHHAPVTLLGVSGSEKYKFLGFSHNLIHETEDLDFCRNIGLASRNLQHKPELVEDAIRDAYNSDEPIYIRL